MRVSKANNEMFGSVFVRKFSEKRVSRLEIVTRFINKERLNGWITQREINAHVVRTVFLFRFSCLSLLPLSLSISGCFGCWLCHFANDFWYFARRLRKQHLAQRNALENSVQTTIVSVHRWAQITVKPPRNCWVSTTRAWRYQFENFIYMGVTGLTYRDKIDRGELHLS